MLSAAPTKRTCCLVLPSVLRQGASTCIAIHTPSNSRHISDFRVKSQATTSDGPPLLKPDVQPKPEPRKTERLTATQRKVMLALAHQESSDALKAAGMDSIDSNGFYQTPAQTVDVRMYESLTKSRNRLATKLSDMNKYVAQLDDRVAVMESDSEAAYEVIKKVVMELGAIARLAEGCAATLQFGVEPLTAADSMIRLAERLLVMQEVVTKDRDTFRAKVVQRVPVTWAGVASEVKLMGQFDNWTNGYDLSASDVEADSVYKTFEALVPLLPGRYTVKFLVDGNWACTGDWPAEEGPGGDLNNILIVD